MNTYSNNHQELLMQIKSLISGESDMIANMANISAVLFNGLEDINWAGFYINRENELVLGPFQGQAACIRIAIGKGVCGTAAYEACTQKIADVHAFEGHIACDSRSNSEIVVPIFDKHKGHKKVIAVLDLDSPKFNRFDDEDQRFLENVSFLLTETLQK